MLLALVGIILGLSLALIPLYEVFTRMTGINGHVADKAQGAKSFQIVKDRVVNVTLLATVAKGVPVKFNAKQTLLAVHPGETRQVSYWVENTTDHAITVHANPSIAPGLAANEFKLLDCFCFTQQQLPAKTAQTLTLSFVLDPKLPAHYNSLVLAQQFFNTK